MLLQACAYDGPDHEYPDDWQFNHLHDPRVDDRFEPTHYQYLDSEYGFSFMTGSYLCDDEALDNFTTVAKHDPKVRYIAAKRPGETKYTLMPWTYFPGSDTVYPGVLDIDEFPPTL